MMSSLGRVHFRAQGIGGRWREASLFRGADRVRVHPFAWSRSAARRRALKPELPPCSLQLDHYDLAARDNLAAAFADALIIERMPVMKFVEVTQNIELVFGWEVQRGGCAHRVVNHGKRGHVTQSGRGPLRTYVEA